MDALVNYFVCDKSQLTLGIQQIQWVLMLYLSTAEDKS